MLRFKFSKLVRDKIVEHQINSGAKPKYTKLDKSSHARELINKIIEESREIPYDKPAEAGAEIADVQQAIDDLISILGLKSSDIAMEQKDKLRKNGGFKEGIYIDYVEIDEGDKWVEYYRKNSDRYPEIKKV